MDEIIQEQTKKVILDGKEVTMVELQEAQNRKDLKIIMVAEDTYKTLQRLQE
jgi:hypothetical protein